VTFAEELFLYGLATGPLLVLFGAWALVRKRRQLGAFSAVLVFLRRRSIAILLLEAALISLVIVALAGPESEGGGGVRQRRPVDLVVALDASSSMLARDVAPDRLGRAKREIKDLLDNDTATSPSWIHRVGLVEFAGSARLVCPMTRDLAAARAQVPEMNGSSLEREGTSFGIGLEAALDAMHQERDRPRAVVIVTDGEERGDPSQWDEAIQRASREGVSVFGLAVGTRDGARIPLPGDGGFLRGRDGGEVLSRATLQALEPAVAATGGICRATWSDPFPMERIGRKGIALLEEKRGTGAAAVGFDAGREGRALFQWFILAALVLFLIKMFLPGEKDAVCLSASRAVLAVALAAGALPLQGCGESVGMAEARAGNGFFRQGRFHRAVAAFDSSLERSPDNADVLLNKGLALYRMGKWERALTTLAEAEKASAGSGEPLEETLQASRFAGGLVLYCMADEAWREGSGEREELEKALESAVQAEKTFRSSARAGFFSRAALTNVNCAAELRERIEKKIAAAPMKGDQESREQGRDDAGSKEGEGGAEGQGREEGRGSKERGSRLASFRQDPSGRVAWEDPGPLSEEEKTELFRRLDEIRKARDEREVERARTRRMEAKEW